MKTRKDAHDGPGSTDEASSPDERSSAAAIGRSSAGVDVGRLKTRVPFDVDEIELLLGTVPFHLLRCRELEDKFGKEAFQSWYDEAARNKEKYLAAYPDIYGSSNTCPEVPESPKEPVDYETQAFEAVCDSIPDIIRAYNQAHLEKDEIGSDVTKEAVERSKAEYKRLNDLLKNFGNPAPRLGEVNLWTDPKKDHRSKQLEDWIQSEAEWAEFSLEVQREVDIVKRMCGNEQYTPTEGEPLTWIDQFVGAVEKETGVPFDKEFAEHMADLAAGKDSDISVRAHVRSLDAEMSAESDDSGEEPEPLSDSAPNAKGKSDGSNFPNEEPRRPVMVDNLEEPSSTFSLEKELRRYVGLKKHFLLSCVHDDGKIKWKRNKYSNPKTKRERPNPEFDEWYFGPKEFIVLKDEGGKKTRTDIIVDRDEDLREKIAIIEGKPAKKKFRQAITSGVDKNHFLKLLLPSRCLEEVGIETGEPKGSQTHNELAAVTDAIGSPAYEVDCEVLEASEEDKGKRLKRRKMYRWERFQFRDALEITDAESELTSSDQNVIDVDCECRTEVPEAPRTAETAQDLAERRRVLADSLFQDDSKKYVEYVDPSEMTGWELHRPMPLLTAANLSRANVSEVVSPELKTGQAESTIQEGVPEKHTDLSGGSAGKSALLDDQNVTSAPVITRESDPTHVELRPSTVEPDPTTTEPPVPQKEKSGSKKDKKDKKKKKRRSSSSSDDLEMLEKKSEARLGLRK